MDGNVLSIYKHEVQKLPSDVPYIKCLIAKEIAKLQEDDDHRQSLITDLRFPDSKLHFIHIILLPAECSRIEDVKTKLDELVRNAFKGEICRSVKYVGQNSPGELHLEINGDISNAFKALGDFLSKFQEFIELSKKMFRRKTPNTSSTSSSKDLIKFSSSASDNISDRDLNDLMDDLIIDANDDSISIGEQNASLMNGSNPENDFQSRSVETPIPSNRSAITSILSNDVRPSLENPNEIPCSEPNKQKLINDLIGRPEIIEVGQPLTSGITMALLEHPTISGRPSVADLSCSSDYTDEEDYYPKPDQILYLKVQRYQLYSGVDIEVEILNCRSPSSFWISTKPSSVSELEASLIEELKKKAYVDQILMPNARDNSFCAAPSNSSYRRGRIMTLKRFEGKTFAKVFYIDHGSWAWLLLDVLLILPERLSYFPWLAIHCRLRGLQPTGSSQKWTSFVVDKFKEFCSSDDLCLSLLDDECSYRKIYTVELKKKIGYSSVEPQFLDATLFLLQYCSNDAQPTGRKAEPRFKTVIEEGLLFDFTTLAKWQTDPDLSIFDAPQNDVAINDDEFESNQYHVMKRRQKRQSAHYRGCSGYRKQSDPNLLHVSGRKMGLSLCYDLPLTDLTAKQDDDHYILLHIKRVIDPNSLYATLIDGRPGYAARDQENFENFTEELTAFYSDPANCVPVYECLDNHPLAAARLPPDPNKDLTDSLQFFRCRVIRRDFISQHQEPLQSPSTFDKPYQPADYQASVTRDVRQDLVLLVEFIDLAIERRQMPASEVFFLDSRFAQLPAMILKCGLFQTRPITEAIKTRYNEWTPEAIVAFASLLDFDRPMKATVLLKEPNSDTLGIALYRFDSAANKPVLINHELVKLSHAKSEIKWVEISENNLHEWDQRIKKRSNTYVDNVVESKLLGEIKKEYHSDEHTSKNSSFVNKDCNSPWRLAFSACRFFEPPKADTIVMASIHNIDSCVKFFATFPQGINDFRRIRYDQRLAEESMKPITDFKLYCEFLNDPKHASNWTKFERLPMVNDCCLVRFTCDNRLYRAKIVDYDPEQSRFFVRYVDYGNTEWTVLSRMFQITQENFFCLPIMACECIISDLKANDASRKSENMNQLWEFVQSREQRIKVVHVVKRPFDCPYLLVDLIIILPDGTSVDIKEYLLSRNFADYSE